MRALLARGSCWLALGGIAALVVGIGLEGVVYRPVSSSGGVAHKAILTALVRSVLSGLVVVSVIALGLLAATVLGRATRRRPRWVADHNDPFAFPWWVKLLVSGSAIFFLIVLGFLFVELAPHRRHQSSTIKRLGVSSNPASKSVQSGLTHFDFLLPLLVGFIILSGIGMFAKFRQLRHRRLNRGRLHRLVDEGALNPSVNSLAEIEVISDPREQVYACWDYAESRLFQLGIGRLRYESPTEFVGRISSSLPFPTLEIEALADLFVEARYSDHGIQKRDGELAYTLTTLFDSACERQGSYA